MTVQAPKGTDDNWECVIPDKWKRCCDYKCQSYEKGKEASGIHTHILIQFRSQRRSNTLAKDMIKENPGAEVDVEVKRGSWLEARNYVMKQDETRIEGRRPVEEGKAPRNWTVKKEREEEMDRLAEQIKEGGLKRVVRENPEYIIKYPNGCKLANELIGVRSEKRTILTTVVWGKAGSGKSTWVVQEARKRWEDDEIYYFSKVGGSRETVWFNGYRGQKCLVMDDINGKSMPLEYMLKITGNDPMDVEYKGGREAAMWEEVWITSNYDPSGWYSHIFEENEEVKNAFLRRINRIIHVKKEGGENVWEVEKDEEPHVMREDFEIIPTWNKTPGWIRREKERERAYGENEEMRRNDCNVSDWNINENIDSEEMGEETERSGIGLIEEEIMDEEINDTPGNSMYWGGEDMALNAENCEHSEWERNNEKRDALSRYFEIVKKTGAVKTRGELLEKIVHGEITYEEGDWIGEMRERERERRKEEEEMIKEVEATEKNHNEEDLERDWNQWIWEKLRPEITPDKMEERKDSTEECLFQIMLAERLMKKGKHVIKKRFKKWVRGEYIVARHEGCEKERWETLWKEMKVRMERECELLQERYEISIEDAKRGDANETMAFCRSVWNEYLRDDE